MARLSLGLLLFTALGFFWAAAARHFMHQASAQGDGGAGEGCLALICYVFAVLCFVCDLALMIYGRHG